jgi:hypothetical protein
MSTPATTVPEEQAWSDEVLARGVQQGNQVHLTILVHRYHSPLLGFLFRLSGGNRPLAEDLVQEGTFIPTQWPTTSKLGGAWTAVSLEMALVALVGGVTNGLLYGWFDTAVYLQLWANIFPATLISTGICILFTAEFHYRRHATFAAFFLAFGCFLLLTPAVFSFTWQINDAYFTREQPALRAEMCKLDASMCETPTEPDIDSGMSELPWKMLHHTAVFLRGTAILLAAWGVAWG